MVQQISQQEALKRGLKRYFTGKPCKNGHIAERFASIRGCVECCRGFGAKTFAKRYASDPEFVKRHIERSSAWKKKNRVRVNATVRAWFAKNPGKNQEYCRRHWLKDPQKRYEKNKAWKAANMARAKETFDQWRANNPERFALAQRASKMNRRAREKENGGRAAVQDIADLFTKQNGRCTACGSDDRIEIDHILPVALGGSSHPHNLQLLCRPCNREKSDKHPDEWNAYLRSRGFPHS